MDVLFLRVTGECASTQTQDTRDLQALQSAPTRSSATVQHPYSLRSRVSGDEAERKKFTTGVSHGTALSDPPRHEKGDEVQREPGTTTHFRTLFGSSSLNRKLAQRRERRSPAAKSSKGLLRTGLQAGSLSLYINRSLWMGLSSMPILCRHSSCLNAGTGSVAASIARTPSPCSSESTVATNGHGDIDDGRQETYASPMKHEPLPCLTVTLVTAVKKHTPPESGRFVV